MIKPVALPTSPSILVNMLDPPNEPKEKK